MGHRISNHTAFAILASEIRLGAVAGAFSRIIRRSDMCRGRDWPRQLWVIHISHPVYPQSGQVPIDRPMYSSRPNGSLHPVQCVVRGFPVLASVLQSSLWAFQSVRCRQTRRACRYTTFKFRTLLLALAPAEKRSIFTKKRERSETDQYRRILQPEHRISPGFPHPASQ